MPDPRFTKRLSRLRNVKLREITEGCNECTPGGPCHDHGLLARLMLIHPKAFAKSLLLPGDQIHPDELGGVLKLLAGLEESA